MFLKAAVKVGGEYRVVLIDGQGCIFYYFNPPPITPKAGECEGRGNFVLCKLKLRERS